MLKCYLGNQTCNEKLYLAGVFLIDLRERNSAPNYYQIFSCFLSGGLSNKKSISYCITTLINYQTRNYADKCCVQTECRGSVEKSFVLIFLKTNYHLRWSSRFQHLSFCLFINSSKPNISCYQKITVTYSERADLKVRVRP